MEFGNKVFGFYHQEFVSKIGKTEFKIHNGIVYSNAENYSDADSKVG